MSRLARRSFLAAVALVALVGGLTSFTAATSAHAAPWPPSNPHVVSVPHLCAPGVVGFTCEASGPQHVYQTNSSDPVVQDTAPTPPFTRVCRYGPDTATGLGAGCYYDNGQVILDDTGTKVVFTYPTR